MNSTLAPKGLQINESGIAESIASEAAFRAGLAGRFTVAPSHDPYNGVRPRRQQPAKRTDLRELSRQIQLRRDEPA